jgi:hypothetical protein
MTSPVPHYERREVNGAYTTLEVDLEPGITAMIPVKTTLIGTPDGDAMIRLALARHAALQDDLRDFT